MEDLGPFGITLDPRFSFDELIAAGAYDFVGPKVELLRPLVTAASERDRRIAGVFGRKPTGGPYREAGVDNDVFAHVDVAIIDFAKNIHPKAVPAYVDMLGVRFADPREMLALVASRPLLPERLWLYAVGGSDAIMDGSLPALAVRIAGGRKILFADSIAEFPLWHSPVLLARGHRP